MAPQEPQYNSFLLASFCILHSPQAGQGGNPLSLGGIIGPRRGFFLLGRNQPFFGLLTLGNLPPLIVRKAFIEDSSHTD